MRPSVTVVVAVREGAAVLAGALDSVIEQLTTRDRVVVIVGPSTDDTAGVARGRRGGHVPVDVIDQSGRGLARARNQAIDLVDHELVAFCDADDRWTPRSLEHRLDAMQTGPGADAAIGAVRTVPINGLDVPAHRRPGVGSVAPGYTPGALLARRELFDVVGGFDEELTIACDSDWFLRLHESGRRMAVVDAVVLEKGVRSGSLSNDLPRYRAELLASARRHTIRRSTAADEGGPRA